MFEIAAVGSPAASLSPRDLHAGLMSLALRGSRLVGGISVVSLRFDKYGLELTLLTSRCVTERCSSRWISNALNSRPQHVAQLCGHVWVYV